MVTKESISDRWIDTIGWKWTDGSMVIGLTRILWSMIDTIDQKEQIFNRWIDTIGGQHDQQYRSIASIDSIGIDPSIHRRLCPSMQKGPHSLGHDSKSDSLLRTVDLNRFLSGELSNSLRQLPFCSAVAAIATSWGLEYFFPWCCGPRHPLAGPEFMYLQKDFLTVYGPWQNYRATLKMFSVSYRRTSRVKSVHGWT
jgi:hypothetical protein